VHTVGAVKYSKLIKMHEVTNFKTKKDTKINTAPVKRVIGFQV
jgi:hypothetical protein